MSTSVPIVPTDEQVRYSFYSAHEEENVPEFGSHEWTVRYSRDGLAALLPDSLVTGNVCVYWEPENPRRYVAPDVFVALARRPKPFPRTYLLWLEPPIDFVMEISSRSTRRIDLEEKPSLYSHHVRAREYFFADPPEEERTAAEEMIGEEETEAEEATERAMYLWRLGPEGYVEVPREPNGRLRSEVLGVEFGWDDEGLLRIYADGEPLPSHGEADRQRREAEARAEAEKQRRAEEAARREEAEARAAHEAAQRQELERQLAELQAQLRQREP